jgi:hypothetical protein
MWKLLCRFGVHIAVEEGGGCMGDALRCLVCGRDRYPESFGFAVVRIPIKVCRKLEVS